MRIEEQVRAKEATLKDFQLELEQSLEHIANFSTKQNVEVAILNLAASRAALLWVLEERKGLLEALEQTEVNVGT